MVTPSSTMQTPSSLPFDPLRCRTCHRTFSRKDNLRTHQRLHTGEKPFLCKYCGQPFRWAGALHTHENLHLRKKPTRKHRRLPTLPMLLNPEPPPERLPGIAALEAGAKGRTAAEGEMVLGLTGGVVGRMRRPVPGGEVVVVERGGRVVGGGGMACVRRLGRAGAIVGVLEGVRGEGREEKERVVKMLVEVAWGKGCEGVECAAEGMEGILTLLGFRRAVRGIWVLERTEWK